MRSSQQKSGQLNIKKWNVSQFILYTKKRTHKLINKQFLYRNSHNTKIMQAKNTQAIN